MKGSAHWSGRQGQPKALVVGFNIHGLAIARTLSKANIDVHVLSGRADLPANHTRYATVHVHSGINSDDLVSILGKFATTHLHNQPAVLYPTSDKMVKAIGNGWQRIRSNYLLSWSDCTSLVLDLQRKSSIPPLCERAGIAHPLSRTINSADKCSTAFADIAGPAIVKPVHPLSGFKALRINTASQLEQVAVDNAKDLPFVLQQYVDGDDDTLYFCTMYLVDGVEHCAFTGRKLQSDPPGLGQGTVMTSEDNEEVLDLTRRFLAGFRLTGPVAVEYKRDNSGKYWLIEPNVGRTEYCVDLLIQAGLNLPLMEFAHVTGQKGQPSHGRKVREVTWYDTEKDPLCFIKHCWLTTSFQPMGKQPIFPYFAHEDRRPFAWAVFRLVQKVANSILRRALRWHRKGFFHVRRMQRDRP